MLKRNQTMFEFKTKVFTDRHLFLVKPSNKSLCPYDHITTLLNIIIPSPHKRFSSYKRF